MPEPANLRLRLQLISRFDQLAARLADGDKTAIEPTHDHIRAMLDCRDMPTLSLIMKAMMGVLESFQGEVDEDHLRF